MLHLTGGFHANSSHIPTPKWFTIFCVFFLYYYFGAVMRSKVSNLTSSVSHNSSHVHTCCETEWGHHWIKHIQIKFTGITTVQPNPRHLLQIVSGSCTTECFPVHMTAFTLPIFHAQTAGVKHFQCSNHSWMPQSWNILPNFFFFFSPLQIPSYNILLEIFIWINFISKIKTVHSESHSSAQIVPTWTMIHWTMIYFI